MMKERSSSRFEMRRRRQQQMSNNMNMKAGEPDIQSSSINISSSPATWKSSDSELEIDVDNEEFRKLQIALRTSLHEFLDVDVKSDIKDYQQPINSNNITPPSPVRMIVSPSPLSQPHIKIVSPKPVKLLSTFIQKPHVRKAVNNSPTSMPLSTSDRIHQLLLYGEDSLSQFLIQNRVCFYFIQVKLDFI